ncbi:NADP-dependent oxidoreductase [Aspergillus lucknowensis]|uniref:Enoyl reductase (ER) domain-containing protein n=1 Tax=Aspergillus lucknowensis TaxID=176173 RepID=A0ABR4M170_9EURO
MQAIRVHPAPQGQPPYSPTNPAPVSALHLDTIPIPHPTKEGQILVKIKASTVIRDTLAWPETYAHEYITPGNDLSGTVVEVFSAGSSKFKPGDEVFGMATADHPATWAEYALVLESEIALKPEGLSWEEAAAVPLSGQTAFEALFVHGGVSVPTDDEEILRNQSKDSPNPNANKVLITGASGGVGVYLVQLARLAGLHVTAATSGKARNEEFLLSLGADETIEYGSLKEKQDSYDLVIDCVGGEPLVNAWNAVKSDGILISVDSSSFNFVEEHTKQGIHRDGVKALFFIVEGTHAGLDTLTRFANLGILRVFVLQTYPLANAREAYEHGNGRFTGRGKIVLSV